MAVALVVLPLVLAIVEFAQLSVARHALNHGVFEAARAAALQEGSEEVLRRSLANAMMPLFAPAASGHGSPDERHALEGMTRAAAEFLRPDLASVSILAAVPEQGLAHVDRSVRVLAVRVRYCRELVFPWHASLRRSWASLSPFDMGCRARGRWPIESVAAVHMQAAAADQS